MQRRALVLGWADAHCRGGVCLALKRSDVPDSSPFRSHKPPFHPAPLLHPPPLHLQSFPRHPPTPASPCPQRTRSRSVRSEHPAQRRLLVVAHARLGAKLDRELRRLGVVTEIIPRGGGRACRAGCRGGSAGRGGRWGRAGAWHAQALPIPLPPQAGSWLPHPLLSPPLTLRAAASRSRCTAP